MVHDGCWSTVICSPRERAELGSTSDSGWVLGCRLSIGHRGDHASDAETAPRFDRRLWLEWNDSEQHAQSLIDRNPCTGGVGARCMLFEGHGGVHWYAPTNGYLTAAGTGRRRAHEDGPVGEAVPATAHAESHHHVSLDHRHDQTTHTSDGSHRVDEIVVETVEVTDVAEIPNLRGRAVRENPLADRHEMPTVPVTAHAAPSVSDALDAVVVALGRLAEALRRAENERGGHSAG